MNIVLKSCRAVFKNSRLRPACEFCFLLCRVTFLVIVCFELFLKVDPLTGRQENCEEGAVAVFKNYSVREPSPVPLKSDVFKLPFVLQSSINDVKNDTNTTTRTFSRSGKKIRSVKRKKRRAYHMKRRTVKRFASSSVRTSARTASSSHLSRDKAEKFARLKIAAGLMWPIRRSDFWISSPFGHRKLIKGRCGFHMGLDMAAMRGTPVRAAASGKVIKTVSSSSGYGNMVLLSHDYQMATRYAHLHRIKVKEGQYVKKGDIIGLVGNTGNVLHRKGRDGSHLHFEVYVGHKRVNPIFFVN